MGGPKWSEKSFSDSWGEVKSWTKLKDMIILNSADRFLDLAPRAFVFASLSPRQYGFCCRWVVFALNPTVRWRNLTDYQESCRCSYDERWWKICSETVSVLLVNLLQTPLSPQSRFPIGIRQRFDDTSVENCMVANMLVMVNIWCVFHPVLLSTTSWTSQSVGLPPLLSCTIRFNTCSFWSKHRWRKRMSWNVNQLVDMYRWDAEFDKSNWKKGGFAWDSDLSRSVAVRG